jgi:protein TonB
LTLIPTVAAFRVPAGTMALRVPPGALVPILISKVDPELTPQAQRAGVQGTVSVDAEIGTDGRIHNARVAEGLGYGLDEKALIAVAQWRFIPGKKNGVPVTFPATLQVYFHRK